jgi:hypothetical protein
MAEWRVVSSIAEYAGDFSGTSGTRAVVQNAFK